MHVVILYGPPAVGKLTVAGLRQKLTELGTPFAQMADSLTMDTDGFDAKQAARHIVAQLNLPILSERE